MAAFGQRVFQKDYAKMRPLEWAPIQCDWCPPKKWKFGHTEKPRVQRGKAMRGHREKVAVDELRREALDKTKPANTLILNYEPSEL